MYNAILEVDGVYHIFTRSIAEFKVFNSESDFLRMKGLIDYYQFEKPVVKFSDMLENVKHSNRVSYGQGSSAKQRLVDIVAYCIMPTHVHLALKQVKIKGISIYISNILNSYTKYFNTKHKRKGPLWEGRFKRVAVMTDEQLLHLTRYIHLNPVTAHIIDKPEDWPWSSYREYLLLIEEEEKICRFDRFVDMGAKLYQKFVEENIDYQRKLARIKHLTID